ncbi:MAG: polysaccharide deacetylase family protein [Nitrososphaera sp.]
MSRRIAIITFSGAAGVLFLAGLFGFPGYFLGGDYLSPSTALVSKGDVIVTNFQPGHGFVIQSASGPQVDDTSDFAIGNQSLKLVTDGDGSAVFTRKSEISPALNFTDRLLKLWIKVNGTGNLSELRVTVTSDDFRTYTDYWIAGGKGAGTGFLVDNEWNVVTLSPSQSAPIGDSDISRVDTIQIRVADDGLGRTLTLWVNSLVLVAKNDRAIVTFAFDDGYDTDYTKARPVLDRYHFTATSYVIASLVGAPGRLNIGQLTNLQELNGWDIASHSYSHLNLTSLAPSEIKNDLTQSQQFLANNGFQKGAGHFAYPYGEFHNDELMRLVQKYYNTARTTEGAVETLPPSDPHRLRAMVIMNTTTLSEVSESVESAIASGDWLILVFHKIVDANANDELAYLTSDFEAIVDDIAASGADVMTVSEVYENRYR